MAGTFRLVSAIEDDIRYRADIQSETTRHTTANIVRLINESAQALRTKLSNMGYSYFLTAGSPTALSTTPQATGETFAEIDFPIGAQHVYGIHVLRRDNFWEPLQQVDFSYIRDFQESTIDDDFDRPDGGPVAFCVRTVPFGVTSTETAGKIMILPLPRTALTYRMFYLPVFTPISASDTFNGQDGWIEWIIWDCVVKIAARDNNMKATHNIALTERTLLEKEFQGSASLVQAATSEEPRDGRIRYSSYPRAL